MDCRANIFRCLAFYFVLQSSTGSVVQAEALNAMKHAEQLFNAGRYEDAAGWYTAELTKNSQNSTAHYMLGVSLSKLHRNSEAVPEFRLAKQYDKTGAISGYCDQFLRSLTPANAANAKESETQFKKSDKHNDENESSKSDATISTAGKIGKVSTSASAALEAQCTAEVDRINKDANDKIQALTAKAEKSLAEVPRSQYRNTGSFYADQSIRVEYQQAVKSVRDEATRKEAEIKEHYRLKQTAVEDAAFSMHKSYESKNQVGKIILSPVGTNMNVRNYQTSDEASGNDVPIVAAPAKVLPVKKLPAH